MANIRKQFNFRNGVQVDDDNLVVSSAGLVGIGTTIPTESLDVRGTAKVVGLVTANQVFTSDLTATNASITSLTLGQSIIGGGVSISSGIVTASASGVVTYYGDGGRLLNLPTSQWLDVDAGLGFTSIYAQGYVGVGTIDPRFLFQISGNTSTTVVGFTSGVGFSSEGNILATGIVTAYKFSGIASALTELNASNIAYGTISNDRIPTLLNSKMPANISVSGIITATGGFIGTVAGNLYGNLTGNVTGNLTGNVTGIASTARSLTGNPDIVVNNVTATSIAVTSISASSIGCTTINSTGIVTAISGINIGVGGTTITLSTSGNGRIGIGSALPNRDIQVIKSGTSSVELIGSSQSEIILGQQRTSVLGIGDSTAVIRFGNAERTFDLINGDSGNFNYYLHTTQPVAGIETGSFNWIYGQTNAELMTLTYGGRLGVGKTNPDHTLHVVGTSTITGNSNFGGNVIINGDATIKGTLTSSGSITLPSNIENTNISNGSGISTFYNLYATNIFAGIGSVGIGTTNPITDLDAKDGFGLFKSIGIGTDQVASPNNLSVSGTILSDSVGIGTTTTTADLGVYGSIDVYPPAGGTASSIYMYSANIDLDENTTVGIGSTLGRASLDFSGAGKGVFGGVGAFMILPTVTSAERSSLEATPGGIIYNSTANEFQGSVSVGVNTSWVNIGIQTASVNSNAVNVSGIVTATNGFISGVGTAVQITTVGNKLVFTVPGVGTTSLTLF